MITETCCKEVREGWRRVPCQNRGKVEVDGKHYCGVHDPRRAQVRQARREAIDIARSNVSSVELEIYTIRQELVLWALAQPEVREIKERWTDAQDRLSDAQDKFSEINR